MREVFGIARDKLRSIIAEAVCEEVDSFELSSVHDIKERYGCYVRNNGAQAPANNKDAPKGDGCYGGCYGIMGEKGVWIFSYVTKSGQRGEKKIFVKKYYDALLKEEEYHYKCLQGYDAPVPRLYGTLMDKEGRETLFLEYLDVVTEDEASFFNGVSKSRILIEAIAKFNRIQPSGEYRRYLEKELEARTGPDDWKERMEAVALSLDDIWKRGLAGELAGELGNSIKKLCSDHRQKKTKLQTHARNLFGLVAGMEKGLCHRDFCHNCAGWGNDDELLVFDLEDVGFDARFTDVALWLGAPKDDPQSNKQRLIAHYLSEYTRRTDMNVSLNQVFFETKVLWQALTLWHMYLCWWNKRLLDKGAELARLPDAKDSIEKTRLGYHEGIYIRLKSLMEHVEL